MKEHEFLEQLQKRASEQEQLIHTLGTPKGVIIFLQELGLHPWRVLLPGAIILTILLRLILGHQYFEFILYLFAKH